ncbi:MAG: beta-ketoacyl synthase N-terminal-like domain-containing protein [Mycobacteriales bacterium]
MTAGTGADLAARDDDVAVVGLGCRVPGAADPEALWRRLLDGVDSVRRYGADELLAAGIPAAVLDDPAYVPAAGHLDDAAGFDAELFGMTDREAGLTDPQQRLFLEVAWTALEHAGQDVSRVDGPVGVFAGAGPNRYFVQNLLGNPAAGPAGDPTDPAGLLGPTLSPDYLPMRVSYRLGLTGPSVAVQTACSSSLVAVCLAVQAVADYRCDLAVAGGASLATAGPAPLGGYRARSGATAPDGLFRPFDAAAQGSVPGSGAAAVVLKRLGDALADGDHVHAVVRGWGIANDGAGRAGFAAPGVSGLAAAVMEALAAAEVDADTVGYVEAHGSATRVGDALEAEALTRAFGARGAGGAGCLLGSARAALGNLDAASGVVGLLAAVLAVRDGVVPPTPHLDTPSPDLDLDDGPFRLATKTTPWTGAGARRAGVSSIGQGGTTAHVLVEQPPAAPAAAEPPTPQVLALSARTPAALAAVAARLAGHLEAHPDLPLRDVAWTLATGRHAFHHRRALACRSTADAVAQLRAGAGSGAGASAGAGPAQLAAAGPGELAAAWVAGADRDLRELFARERPRRVPLPAYPFERTRHWIVPGGSR